MTRYDKYRVTAESCIEENEDKMTLFVPWGSLEDYVSLLLNNCMNVMIDGGIQEKED